MAPTLDDIDHRILEALRRDGRLSMRSLAESLHVSRANAYVRVERLKAEGVIRGFSANIDSARSGLGTSAYVSLNLRQTEWRNVRQQLQALSGVTNIALVGGEFDVLLLVRVQDNAALRRLVLDEIQSLDGVVTTRTFLVFEEAEPSASGRLSSEQTEQTLSSDSVGAPTEGTASIS